MSTNHIGDVRAQSLDPEIYAKQLEANRAEPNPYRGRDDLNPHIPLWSKPLVYEGDYARLQAWIDNCRLHGYDRVRVSVRHVAEAVSFMIED